MLEIVCLNIVMNVTREIQRAENMFLLHLFVTAKVICPIFSGQKGFVQYHKPCSARKSKLRCSLGIVYKFDKKGQSVRNVG